MKLIKILPVVFLFSVFLVSGYPDTICYPLSSGTVCFNTTTITGIGDYGATSGDNTSWNQSLADSLYAPISVTGDNASWNESYADTKYALVGAGADNTSWNESYADTLYTPITNLNSSYWQRRVSNCSADESIREIGSDGSVVCEPDTDTQLSDGDIAAMGYTKIPDNTSWNETKADSKYLTSYTDSFWSLNTTVLENQSGVLGIKMSWLNALTSFSNYILAGTSNAWVIAGENITSGTVADARIASTITRDSEVPSLEDDPLWQGNWSGYNKANWDTAYSWGNHSAAGYLTSYTETDPNWAANMTLYVPKGTINAWTLVKANISDFPTVLSSFTDDLGHVEDNTSWNQGVADGLYYAIDNPDGFITEYQNLTEDNVEAYIFDNDNTASLNLSGYNITGVNAITFTNNMKIYVLNSSALRIG